MGPCHDRRVDETPSPFAVLVQAPGRFDSEELIEALAGIDAPGRVASLRDFDEEATRRARELAADNLDASPTVIRREIAGFGRAYPRCSGMVRDEAFELDAAQEAVHLAADADTPARVRRLMRAAAEYGVVGTTDADDERATRLRAFRGQRRSAFWIAWWKLLAAAEDIDMAARQEAERRVAEMRPEETSSGDGVSADLHEIIDVVKVVVQPVAEAAVPMVVGAVVDWLRRRRKSGKPEPEVVTIVDGRGAVISRVTRNPEGLPVASTPARR